MGRTSSIHIKIDYRKNSDTADLDLEPKKSVMFDAKYPVPHDYGTGWVRVVQVSPDLGYARLVGGDFSERINMRMEVPTTAFKVTFHDSPDTGEAGIEQNRTKIYLNRYDSYILSPAVVGTMNVAPEVRIDETSFFITTNRFCSFIEDIGIGLNPEMEKLLENPLHDLVSLKGKVTPPMLIGIRQMQNCTLSGSLKKVYLEGKLLEFLALRCRQMCEDADDVFHRAGVKLTAADRDKIRDAGKLLNLRFHNPPTITDLAREIGLNTTKLKAGFKSEFGTTVFGYIHTLRMRLAVDLLLETDKNITEVAWEVGYAGPSAFSSAFKREMGFSPSLLK